MKKMKLVFYLCSAMFVSLYMNTVAYAQEESPQRIISLGPAITEELYLLRVEDRVVGVTTYCQRPIQAQEKEKIGTVIEVNLEKIVSLNPDLVLATSLTDLRSVGKLRDLGIKVVSFSSAQSFTQIYAQFLELGRVVGRQTQARDIILKAQIKIDMIKGRVKDLPKPKVFVQIGAKPLFTVTEGSFINDFIEFAGGKNIVGRLKNGRYSREKVLRDNPDVIIIATMGILGEEEKRIWQKYKTLSATKNDRIHIIDSSKLCSPTPITFVEVLEEMVGILHQL